MNGETSILHTVPSQLEALAQAGGMVLWPLLAVGLWAWTLVLLRVMTLQRFQRAHGQWVRSAEGTGQSQRCAESCEQPDLVQGVPDGFGLHLRLWKTALGRHSAVVDALVAAAPLLGLLGTVSGMIATFQGLTTMTLFSESGGIAGGISEALTTTQAGLVIAIPVFFANRVIGRKVRQAEQKLEAMGLALQRRSEGSAS